MTLGEEVGSHERDDDLSFGRLPYIYISVCLAFGFESGDQREEDGGLPVSKLGCAP